MVASIAVDYSEFHSDVSERLATVGYGSSIDLKTFGVDWKRGALAEAAAKAAGFAFQGGGLDRRTNVVPRHARILPGGRRRFGQLHQ